MFLDLVVSKDLFEVTSKLKYEEQNGTSCSNIRDRKGEGVGTFQFK